MKPTTIARPDTSRSVEIDEELSGSDVNQGTVPRLASGGAETGTYLTVVYEVHDNEGHDPAKLHWEGNRLLYTTTVPVTVDMLEGQRTTGITGDYPNLTIVVDENHRLLDETGNRYTLHVVPNPYDIDFPEYPDEGSVRLDKTGYGVNFQQTGLARIEVDVAGIPLHKGADITVILDTSSSMTGNKMPDAKGNEKTRLEVMKQCLLDLVTKLQKPYDDGTPADVRIAIADFNDFTSYNEEIKGTYSTTYVVPNRVGDGDGSLKNWVRGKKESSNYYHPGRVYTGTKAADAGAYVDINAMSNFDYSTITARNATSYDEAFNQAYRLVSAILQQNAKDKVMSYMANSATELTKAFSDIADHIQFAGVEGRLMDKMGPNYDLYTTTNHYDNTINTQCPSNVNPSMVPTPTIRVLGYPTYREHQIGQTVTYKIGNTTYNHLVTTEDVGNRYGEAIVHEVVTFSGDGTTATSSALPNETNIIVDVGSEDEGTYVKVVKGANFYYNTDTNNPAYVPNMNGGSEPVMIPPETFYWFIGDITDEETVLEYYTYLTGCMEGGREKGTYETNTYAILYYRNMLGNNVHQDTVTPVFPWQEALVEIAYYLVDSQGRPVTNRVTGYTGSFSNRIVIKEPTLYKVFNINETENIPNDKFAAAGNLPEGYNLYDPNVAYAVKCESGVTAGESGFWTISGTTGTTYVDNYASSHNNPATNTASSENVSLQGGDTFDFSRTTVWVAVTCERGFPIHLQ